MFLSQLEPVDYENEVLTFWKWFFSTVFACRRHTMDFEGAFNLSISATVKYSSKTQFSNFNFFIIEFSVVQLRCYMLWIISETYF